MTPIGTVEMLMLYAGRLDLQLWVIFIKLQVLLTFGISAVMCTGAIPYSNAYFGRATGALLVDNIRCQGTEENLLDCPKNAVGVLHSYCDHYDDVGVHCPRKSLYYQHIQLF